MASEQVDRDATQRVAESAAGVVSSGGARPADPDATLRVAPLAFELVLSGGQRVFGRYTLEAEIGRGGMGVVWRARDEELGETVALKFLPAAVARDAVAVEELKDETRRARRLTHPNIVRIHDFVRDAAMAAVSMEYVDGQTLSVLRLGQPARMFSERTLEPLVKQICGALDYAHTQAKIVHRDLKPANVLVTKDGAVKITDFGIARSLTESTTRLTGKSGDTSGTLPYMSPQQLAGEKPMAADDIYALGATLYELLTTKPPFHRGNPYSLMLQIREKTPLSLVEQRAELEVTGEPIPLAWVRTILACLAKEVGGRPSSAGEALARLGLGPPAGVLAEETGHVPLRTDETIKIEVPPAMAGGTSAVSPAAVLEVAGTRCPSCGKATRETSRHCPHCGADLTEACPECNGRNRAGALYCEECGLDMNALRAVEEAVALAGRQREGENFEGAKETLNRVADAAARLKADGRSGLRQKFDQLCGEVDEAFVAAENHREEAERLRAEAVNSETRGLWKEAAKSWRELADLTGDTAAEASAKRCNARARFEEAKKARDAVATYQAAADWQVVAVPEEKLDDGVWNQLAVQALAQVEEESRKLVAAGRHAELDNAWEPLLQTYVVHDPVRAVEAKARLAERRQEMQATLWAKVAEAERALPLAQRGGRWGEVEETCFRALGFLSALPPEGASAGRTVRQVRDQLQEWRAKATRARVVAQRRNAALAVAILACIGALYYFGMELPRQRAEQVRLERERVAKRRQEKLAEQARLERERSEAERLWIEQRKLRDAGRPWVIPGLNVTMIPIAAGTFTMGSQNGHSDEKPVRQVTLTQRFWLGKTEVPQREWAAVMGGNPSNFKGDSLPVEQVSWTDAMEFCRKLTERERGAGRLPEGYAYTLPTEAQWEYACRAGTTGDYSGRLDEMGWYDKNSGSKTHPVGTKKANAWGLYDMHGNVWEWCADWYGNYAGGSVRDPKGAASGSLRVFRGGGWCNGSVFCRSAIRRWNAPGIRFDYLGFRLALVPQVSQ